MHEEQGVRGTCLLAFNRQTVGCHLPRNSIQYEHSSVSPAYSCMHSLYSQYAAEEMNWGGVQCVMNAVWCTRVMCVALCMIYDVLYLMNGARCLPCCLMPHKANSTVRFLPQALCEVCLFSPCSCRFPPAVHKHAVSDLVFLNGPQCACPLLPEIGSTLTATLDKGYGKWKDA